jgi:uncharacterized ferritin-like protein (DUF455 family)
MTIPLDKSLLDPCLHEQGPSREPHVTVVDTWLECANLPDDHPEKEIEFLHRQLNEEANVMENAASSLVDFPDEPWEIRMYLARQCADEARHVIAYQRLFKKRGGTVGQYPVMNFQFKILKSIDSLLGRLAVQNRTFEADGLDAAVVAIEDARERGLHDAAEMYDSQAADEILHVGFANSWIKRQVKENPGRALTLASALTHASRVFAQVVQGGGGDQDRYPVAEEARLQAGFDEAEVQAAVEMNEARREAVRAKRRNEV